MTTGQLYKTQPEGEKTPHSVIDTASVREAALKRFVIPFQWQEEIEKQFAEDATITPGFTEEFYTKFLSAFFQAIEQTEYTAIVQDFLSAYEYRRQIPWVRTGESDATNGLANAINSALEIYHPCIGERLISSLNLSSKREDRVLDQKEKSLLEQAAATAAAQNLINLHTFAHFLSSAKLDARTITVDQLSLQIAGVMRKYADCRDQGLSRDPW